MNDFSDVQNGNPKKDLNKHVETFGQSKLVNDPRLNDMWHLRNLGFGYGVKNVDLNIIEVWKYYTGKGVRVGIIDDGYDYEHPDLKDNYDKKNDLDSLGNDDDAYPGLLDGHGTMVMGVVAAARNNNHGGAGVSPDVKVNGYRMGFGADGTFAQEIKCLEKQYLCDVSNNSWGYGGYFYDNYLKNSFKKQGEAIQKAVLKGRDGLGTVMVFAAGNDRTIGQNVNYHSFNSDRRNISVAAITSWGDYAYFSTPGAAILVAAPGQSVLTTISDDDGSGTNTRFRDYEAVNGTSFASPAIAGVCALVLEANPNLGWRDVQEILAYSARKNILDQSGWATNKATHINGGGMHYSHDFGFGMPDAAAAVRLAETWDKTSTSYNEHSVEAFSNNVYLDTKDNQSVSHSLTINEKIDIDDVEVDLRMTHKQLGDVVVKLVSPGGTESVLIDRPGVGSESTVGVGNFTVNFTLTSRHFRGETGKGEWKLVIEDQVTGHKGRLTSWRLRLIGDNHKVDNTYFYTDEYAFMTQEQASRTLLSDTNGGIDTLNFAAMSNGITFNMAPGANNRLVGKTFAIANDTLIEKLIGTHKRDVLTGNNADNYIFSGKGDDNVKAGRGNDTIVGGEGLDVLTGGLGQDTFVYRSKKDGGDVIRDFQFGIEGDIIDLSQWVKEQKYENRDLLKEGLVRLVPHGNHARLLVKQKDSVPGTYVRMATLQNAAAGNFLTTNFRFH